MLTLLSSRASTTVARVARSSFRFVSNLKAYPGYSVFGEGCILNLKFIPPHYRVVKSEIILLDYNKRGRILLEWSPRAQDGTIDRNGILRFAMSAEETMLLVDQVQQGKEIEIARTPTRSDGNYGFMAPAEDVAEKVLRVTPGPGGSVSYRVDFEKNGIGGQQPFGEETAIGPLEVTAQLGEQKVMEELMRWTVPKLVGWETMTEIAVTRAVQDSVNNRET